MKRTGRKATEYLAEQTRTHRTRRPRSAASFPGVMRDWLFEASKHGELRLDIPKGMQSPHGLVLELRKMIRAMVDEQHEHAGVAASVMILPPEGQVVRIVRRDRGMDKISVEVIDYAPVPSLGAVGKPDLMDAIFAEQAEKDARAERLRFLLEQEQKERDTQVAQLAAEGWPTGLGEASHE